MLVGGHGPPFWPALNPIGGVQVSWDLVHKWGEKWSSTEGLLQHLQWCGLCVSLSWRRKSWTQRQKALLTCRSTFPPSPMVTCSWSSKKNKRTKQTHTHKIAEMKNVCMDVFEGGGQILFSYLVPFCHPPLLNSRWVSIRPVWRTGQVLRPHGTARLLTIVVIMAADISLSYSLSKELSNEPPMCRVREEAGRNSLFAHFSWLVLLCVCVCVLCKYELMYCESHGYCSLQTVPRDRWQLRSILLRLPLRTHM